LLASGKKFKVCYTAAQFTMSVICHWRTAMLLLQNQALNIFPLHGVVGGLLV